MKYSEGTIEFPILKDMLDLLIQRRIKMERQYRMKEWTFLDKKNCGHKFLSRTIIICKSCPRPLTEVQEDYIVKPGGSGSVLLSHNNEKKSE